AALAAPFGTMANASCCADPPVAGGKRSEPSAAYRTEDYGILYWTNREAAIGANKAPVFGPGRGQVSVGLAHTRVLWGDRYSSKPTAVIRNMIPMSWDSFIKCVGKAAAMSISKSIIIFIPGYWNDFDDVIKTASRLRSRF